MSLQVNRIAYMACNFNYLTEGLFKVTGSHAHGKSGNILETVKHRNVATTYN